MGHQTPPRDDLEIIVNLWYLMGNDGLIYSLRGRLYLEAGTDQEKIEKLRSCAGKDYLIARPFPIPQRLYTTLQEGGQEKTLPVIHVDCFAFY